MVGPGGRSRLDDLRLVLPETEFAPPSAMAFGGQPARGLFLSNVRSTLQVTHVAELWLGSPGFRAGWLGALRWAHSELVRSAALRVVHRSAQATASRLARADAPAQD